MVKQLKLNINDLQIAKSAKLKDLQSELAIKKQAPVKKKLPPKKTEAKKRKPAEKKSDEKKGAALKKPDKKSKTAEHVKKQKTKTAKAPTPKPPAKKPSLSHPEEKHPSKADETIQAVPLPTAEKKQPPVESESLKKNIPSTEQLETTEKTPLAEEQGEAPTKADTQKEISKPDEKPKPTAPTPPTAPKIKLGPTGKHIVDLLPKPHLKPEPTPTSTSRDLSAPKEKVEQPARTDRTQEKRPFGEERFAASQRPASQEAARMREPISKDFPTDADIDEGEEYGRKKSRVKEYHDVKPLRKTKMQPFHSPLAIRGGVEEGELETRFRRRKTPRQTSVEEQKVVRPASITVRLPISIKDLAAEMKLKASQLISKLFMQGVVMTLNDLLEDETTVQLMGAEFGCDIKIDVSEERRIQITEKTITEEIADTEPQLLQPRGVVVAFMGHVDHGKTSLIDSIRKSKIAQHEAGAITQHIGAFLVKTSHGILTILDTPGHEAFSAMRARGANVTDMAILVVAGDEGIKQQTIEAIQHAKAANVTILVAINKCDKPGFNAENVYRQLADHDLLPEAWGGTTVTVNCSAKSGEGIDTLLEMIALQAEVLELKANPEARARGRVLESEMHKGMGAVATLLVLNGTLHKGDALVFDCYFGRIKTMRNEEGKELEHAPPSTPVEVTGLSGLPEAGEEFIVVANEKDARQIAELRMQQYQAKRLQQAKRMTLENLLQDASAGAKKVLNVILRADMQGSLEALASSLSGITSQKAVLNVVSSGIGEISESDVELAKASGAMIVGFHTRVEAHAENIIKQTGVRVELYDVIYHAIDGVKEAMRSILDKIAEHHEKGEALILQVFKSSQFGAIAGCSVTSGTITRSNQARIVRGGEVIWKGNIASLRRGKDDAKEVQKGMECGILLQGFQAFQPDDIIQTYETVYIEQEL